VVYSIFAGIRARYVDFSHVFNKHQPCQVAFYDFNLATNTRNDVFSVAAFYPFWNGIIPDQILADPKSAFAAFSSVNMVLSRYNGTFPSTFIDTGLQW